MTRNVARPSNVGALWAGNLYRGFTVCWQLISSFTTCGFFVLKTYLLLEADGEGIVLVQKLLRWLARTRVIE